MILCSRPFFKKHRLILGDVKKLAKEHCNIEPEHMRLIYNGRQLKDWDTLECYNAKACGFCEGWMSDGVEFIDLILQDASKSESDK